MKFEMPVMNVISFESKEMVAAMVDDGENFGPARDDSTVI